MIGKRTESSPVTAPCPLDCSSDSEGYGAGEGNVFARVATTFGVGFYGDWTFKAVTHAFKVGWGQQVETHRLTQPALGFNLLQNTTTSLLKGFVYLFQAAICTPKSYVKGALIVTERTGMGDRIIDSDVNLKVRIMREEREREREREKSTPHGCVLATSSGWGEVF